MKVVYKYVFNEALDDITVPAGKVALVAAQRAGDTRPTVWVYIDGSAERMQLRIKGTGHPVIGTAEHVGSAVCLHGDLVWHVFRVQP